MSLLGYRKSLFWKHPTLIPGKESLKSSKAIMFNFIAIFAIYLESIKRILAFLLRSSKE